MRKISLALIVVGLFVSCGNKSSEKIAPKEEIAEETVTETKQTVSTIALTKAEFFAKVANHEENPKEWKYLGDKPALIDFYADWCGPCKAIAPSLEELAAEYADDIYIYKVDVDNEKELATLYGIRSIPALLFVPMNGEPQMREGAASKEDLKATIEELLLKK